MTTTLTVPYWTLLILKRGIGSPVVVKGIGPGKPALLIDASIYIFRPYFSLPEHWHHPENGFPLNAVYGFSRWLIHLLAQCRPARVMAAFDESLGQCFRNTLYADYKKSRTLPDEALGFQLETCKEVCRQLGVAVFASQEFEADDLLASAAHHCRQASYTPWVLSADKDLAQLLVGEYDRLWDFDRKPPLDRQGFIAQRGFDPRRMAELLALTGDPVDDIPGIPGVGVKTAAALLQRFESLAALLQGADVESLSGIRGGLKLAEKIDTLGEQVRLAHSLTLLRADALPDTSVSDFRWQGVSENALYFFEEAGLSPIAARLRRSGLL